MDKKDILDIVNQDSLLIAEQITGKSYKEDEETSNLGLGLHMLISEQKSNALSSVGDTHFRMSYEYYEKILEELGLEKVASYPAGHRCGETDNTAHIYASRDGLLVSSDTWEWSQEEPATINGGQLYFCLRLNCPDDYSWESGLRNSGGHKEVDGTWYMSGYMDVREALKTRINIMRENGEFVNPWTCMSMGPYFMQPSDWKRYKDNDPQREGHIYQTYMDRVATLPEWVQKMMAVHTDKKRERYVSRMDT